MQKFGSKRGFKPKKGEDKLSKNDFSNVFFLLQFTWLGFVLMVKGDIGMCVAHW